MHASATSHLGRHHRSSRLPSEDGACLQRIMHVSVGMDREDSEWAYREARGPDFRAQQCDCGTAYSRRHLDHP